MCGRALLALLGLLCCLPAPSRALLAGAGSNSAAAAAPGIAPGDPELVEAAAEEPQAQREELEAQRKELEEAAPEMEARLKALREAWDAAKLAVRARALRAAERAAEKVESDYDKKLGDLEKVGFLMTDRARAMLNQAAATNRTISDMDEEAKKQQARTDAMARRTQAALKLVGRSTVKAEMKEDALTAEHLAAEVNKLVEGTLATLDEASIHSANASAIALQAVHQATQNALKLTKIKDLVADAQQAARDAAVRIVMSPV